MLSAKIGSGVSEAARKRLGALRPAPTLDSWRNPVTRPLARRLMNEALKRSVDEIDFDYRLTPGELGEREGVFFEAAHREGAAPFLIFIHGGDFVAGGPETNIASALGLAEAAGAEGFALRYPLLPEGRFPAPVEAAFDVIESAMRERGPERVCVVAEGVGASIALGALLALRDEGAQTPCACAFFSPAVDDAGASDAHRALRSSDPIHAAAQDHYQRALFQFYAPERAKSRFALSVLEKSFEGLPAMLIQVGARETRLGDAARLAERARRHGLYTDLQVFDGLWHRFHAHWSLPETRAAHQDAADFIARLQTARTRRRESAAILKLTQPAT